MSAQPETFYTPEEYLELEREAEIRSEYLDGQIFAMSGASEAHIIITDNLSAELRIRLRGSSCRSYSSQMKVLINATGLYTYPDIVVVCGERQFVDDRRDIITNPTVLIEVLSPSTELYDRTKKFAHYRQLESLTDYVLVAQDRPYVDHFIRQSNQEWLLRVSDGMEGTISIPSIGCTLALADVYKDVEFAAEEAEEVGEGEVP
jgi:Uma2 family endonuclease